MDHRNRARSRAAPISRATGLHYGRIPHVPVKIASGLGWSKPGAVPCVPFPATAIAFDCRDGLRYARTSGILAEILACPTSGFQSGEVAAEPGGEDQILAFPGSERHEVAVRIISE